jgi:hypothetical protein
MQASKACTVSQHGQQDRFWKSVANKNCAVKMVSSKRAATVRPAAEQAKLPPWDIMWEYLLDNKV